MAVWWWGRKRGRERGTSGQAGQRCSKTPSGDEFSEHCRCCRGRTSRRTPRRRLGWLARRGGLVALFNVASAPPLHGNHDDDGGRLASREAILWRPWGLVLPVAACRFDHIQRTTRILTWKQHGCRRRTNAPEPTCPPWTQYSTVEEQASRCSAAPRGRQAWCLVVALVSLEQTLQLSDHQIKPAAHHHCPSFGGLQALIT